MNQHASTEPRFQSTEVIKIYLKLASEQKLNATEEEADALIEALHYNDEYRETLDSKECHGIEIVYCSSCAHLFVLSENLNPDWRKTVPKRFLALLGGLIARNGLDYLTLVESVSDADNVHIADEWVGEVRILTDGSIQAPNHAAEEGQ
jgi:hypothetical protein